MAEVNGPLRELVTAGRLAAERTMLDTCTITSPGARTFNDTSGHSTTAATTVYDGRCRVKRTQVADTVTDAGARQAGVREYVVVLPAATAGISVGDTVTVTASIDASQVGLIFTVLDVEHGTTSTARRLRCQEVTA